MLNIPKGLLEGGDKSAKERSELSPKTVSTIGGVALLILLGLGGCSSHGSKGVNHDITPRRDIPTIPTKSTQSTQSTTPSGQAKKIESDWHKHKRDKHKRVGENLDDRVGDNKDLESLNGLKLTLDERHQIEEKIKEIKRNKNGLSISSVYTEKYGEIQIINEGGKIQMVINNGEKNNELIITTENGKNLESMKKYEMGGKSVVIKEVGKEGGKKDAVLTFFGFSGGHTEGDGKQQGMTSSDKFSTNARVSAKLTKDISLGGGVKLGPEQLAFLVFTGVDFGKYGKVLLFVENYGEKNPFNTSVGEKEVWEEQRKIAVGYKKGFNDGALKEINVKGSYTSGKDAKVFSRDYTTNSTIVTDTPDSTITTTTKNTYRTTGTDIGGTELQGIIETVWKLSKNQKLTAGVQVTNRGYNDGISLGTNVGGELGYEAVIREYYKLKLGVAVDEQRQNYKAGIYRKVGANGEIGLTGFYNKQEDGRNYSGIMVGYTQSFGGAKTSAKPEKYELFPERGRDINEEAMKFAADEASEGLTTLRKYEERTRLVDSKSTTDVKEKTKPQQNSENPDITDNTYSVKTGEEVTKYPLSDDKNVKSIDSIVSKTAGCEATLVAGNGVNFKADTAGTYIVVNEVLGTNNKTYNETLTFNVYNNTSSVETPPQISEIGELTGTKGSDFSYDLSSKVTLTDGDSLIGGYVLTGTLPAGITYNSTNGKLSGIPTESGTFNLTLKVKDKDGESTKNFTIKIKDANTAPTGPSLSDVTIGDKLGANPIDPIDTSTGVSDPNAGDTLTYSATGLPSGLSINFNSGIITGTIDVEGNQTYNITVTVSDGKGGTLVRSFTLTITDQG